MIAKPEVTNPGTVVSVRGRVVGVVFDERLPPICSVLRAGDIEMILTCMVGVQLTVPRAEVTR